VSPSPQAQGRALRTDVPLVPLTREPTVAGRPCDHLRAERRRLTAEVQRLSWLRRLVQARSDLEVARLTGLEHLMGDSHLHREVQESLALAPVSGPDLLVALSSTVNELETARRAVRAELDDVTDQLLEVLTADPTACLDL
jgi:hypothetical protein